MDLKGIFKSNKSKLLLILALLLIGFLALFEDTFQNRTDTAYCTSCHMMKPEFYTWQASSHKQVADCVTCHAPPGVLKKMKYRLLSVKEVYAAVTGNYVILIQATTPIPDSTCTQCHDMSKRKVTPSGDLIIPHDKHAVKGIGCTKCHTGITHGNIAQKKITFQSDYSRWDESLGQRFMSDEKNIRPAMDTCMDCHKVRKAPLDCSACHKTSMIPVGHKNDEFKLGGHGKIDSKELFDCDVCHSYMSKETVEVIKGGQNKYLQFLNKNGGKESTAISVRDYAKTNTFCKDCHAKRPPSHKVESFEKNHGQLAQEDQEKCFTCHNNQLAGEAPVTKIACASCHPSSHYKSPWRNKHPVPLPDNPQITSICYTCHNEKLCIQCHTGTKSLLKVPIN